MLQITEIKDRSEQGVSKPFICTASDGQWYFVKGMNTDRQSLINEWLCAHLAREFGLPIPTFHLLYLTGEHYEHVKPAHKEIGMGYMFGSQRRDGVDWLEKHHVSRIGASLKKDILVFDRWVQNTDRTDGNPNLIFDTLSSELSVIDHNLAFDGQFNDKSFLQHHVFRDNWGQIVGDWVEKNEYNEKIKSASLMLDAAWQTIPEEWFWLNEERDVPANTLSKDHITNIT